MHSSVIREAVLARLHFPFIYIDSEDECHRLMDLDVLNNMHTERTTRHSTIHWAHEYVGGEGGLTRIHYFIAWHDTVRRVAVDVALDGSLKGIYLSIRGEGTGYWIRGPDMRKMMSGPHPMVSVSIENHALYPYTDALCFCTSPCTYDLADGNVPLNNIKLVHSQWALDFNTVCSETALGMEIGESIDDLPTVKLSRTRWVGMNPFGVIRRRIARMRYKLKSA